jgi:hypothetical protein
MDTSDIKYLQGTQDGFELIFPQNRVLANLGQAIDGFESHIFYFIIKHVHQEIEGHLRKLQVVQGQ